MGATITCSKEGDAVVVDVKDWNNDAMLRRLSEVIEWARDSNLSFLDEIDVTAENPDNYRLEVPKEHFIELWKFLWSYVPPKESELTKWRKWLQRE